ncbi:hypothetical protein DFH28DRAFT_1047290 [Melampsora americana]|nr:hypothetical protein DFH28DRAFT_1047290 [Melampsora americana]
MSAVDTTRSESTLPSRLLDASIPLQPIMPARSPSRTKTGKRSFFSTLLQRASGNGSSTSSSPGPSLSTNHLRTNQPTGAFSQPTTPQLNPSPRINPDGSTNTHSRRLSRSYSESATARPQNLTNSTSSLATPHNLKSIGLKLTPLTPFLPISRNAHPLCGAILDNKYLLIGTNHGLDFVPLPHLLQSRCGDGMNGYGTVKPMTLIKKTRFKSLKVLEVRSNILLAIAGRNDHLRVYALDGIRAIIAKKMQDLEDKDDYVWLAKPSRSDSQSVASKGKGRANIRTNDLPHLPSNLSPPPPYGHGASHGSNMAKSYSLQPGDIHPVDRVSPTNSPVSLRRSSTVGARISDVNHHRNIINHVMHSPDSKRITSGLPSFLSSATRTQKNISSTPPSLAYRNGSLESPTLQPIRDEIGLGLEREIGIVDGPSQIHPAVSSSQLISQDDGISTRHEGYQSTSSHSTETDREAVPPQTDLVALIRQRKQKQLVAKAEGLVSSQSNSPARTPSRRLVARSPLIGDTDEESVEGAANEYLPIPTTNTRISLLDILSQSSPSTGGTLAARPSSSKQPPVANKRWTSIERYQSRTDSSGGLAEPSLPENPVPFNLSRNASSPVRTSETLSVPTPSLGGRLSPTPSPTSSPILALQNSRAPTPLCPPEPVNTPTVTPKSKKRWSVMDSVFRSSNSSNTSSSANKLPTLLPSISNEADPMVALGVGVNQNNIVGTSDDQPRERLATHHHGHNPNDPKTSPHPATLGAPLEYVKLARTKGAKLLRAFETKRRTYLAVLCGESSERIELFTGSKNISLSLNRTFVLPETPRTIEFQMQGDDLVDIYLVYDESVFALEPATVRVREVGIGRNERRAARRERERAARDLASTNLRQPVTANTGVTDDINLVIPTNLSQPERTDSLGPHGTLPDVPPPVPVDEGLTLSVPANSSSRNANTSNVGPTVVGVVSSTNNGAGGWGANDNNSTGATKPVNLWPYTTFQQLQSIPPLPASVLASTFVIPPTYEAVVMASGGPSRKALTPSHSSGSVADWTNDSVADGIRTESPPSIHLDQLAVIGSSQMHDADSDLGHHSIHHNSALANAITNTITNQSELTPNEVADAGEGLSAIPLNTNTPITSSPGLVVNDGPLLSPISLLANPHSRQIGPPGLFLVSRGKKITSIVDCDGRSVMKKPFVWSNDKHSKPMGNVPENPQGFKIDMIIVKETRTMMVGIDSNEVKVFEIGGQPAIGLEEYSNSITLDIVPQFYGLPFSSSTNPNPTGGSNSGPFGGSLISSTSNHHSNGGIAVGGGNGVGIITSQNGGSNFTYPSHPSQPSQSIHQLHPHTSSSLSNSHGMFGYHLNHSNLIGISSREIIYLGFNEMMNQVIWSERRGNMFGIYCLEPV